MRDRDGLVGGDVAQRVQSPVGPAYAEFQDGSSQVVDETYIMNSIMYPHDQIVKGFDTTKMTVFSGNKPFDDPRSFMSMLEFIKILDRFDTKTLKLKPDADTSDLKMFESESEDEPD